MSESLKSKKKNVNPKQIKTRLAYRLAGRICSVRILEMLQLLQRRENSYLMLALEIERAMNDFPGILGPYHGEMIVMV